MTLPKLFIGSSKEARDAGLLEALQHALEIGLNSTARSIDLVPWPISPWINFTVAMQTLVESLVDYSYGVFILSADDELSLRGIVQHAARDNVIFEFGLFLAHLGPERTFLVGPADTAKTIAMSAVKALVLHTTPPPELPLRVLTDLGSAYRKGHYTILNPGPSPTITFQVSDVIAQINDVEKRNSGLTPPTANTTLVRRLHTARAAISVSGKSDSYYTGQLFSHFRDIAALKAQSTSRSVQNAVQDLLLAVERVPDFCELSQLASLQHHTNNISEVWVFADSPLEFRAGMPTDQAYLDLRGTIVANLRHGVNYVYFVGPDFAKSDVDHLVPVGDHDRAKMLKRIHVVKVSSHLFSTYFTLHFQSNQKGPTAIYMSSVMRDRKDLLLQVSDGEHVQRIYERICVLRGDIENEHSPRVTRYVL